MTPKEGERLARIETLLETVIENQKLNAQKFDELQKEVTADKAELAALKNKGAGLLIGVGLAGGTVGALFTKLWHAIFAGGPS